MRSPREFLRKQKMLLLYSYNIYIIYKHIHAVYTHTYLHIHDAQSLYHTKYLSVNDRLMSADMCLELLFAALINICFMSHITNNINQMTYKQK